jgi:hypothetical protein
MDHDNWREGTGGMYRRLLEDVKQSPPRWDTYPEPRALHDRLWDSIDALDIVHEDLGFLAKRARRKHRNELAIRIDQARENVSLALSHLDPHWPEDFVNFEEDVSSLRTALECLQQALMLFSDAHEQISVDIEAPRRRKSWFA